MPGLTELTITPTVHADMFYSVHHSSSSLHPTCTALQPLTAAPGSAAAAAHHPQARCVPELTARTHITAMQTRFAVHHTAQAEYTCSLQLRAVLLPWASSLQLTEALATKRLPL